MASHTSGFQTPITIKDATEEIKQGKYLLPIIQREFVWDDDQIIKLFDSLMRGYPIGSFLFWKVREESVDKYQFYKFITSFTEMDNTHNQKANVSGEKEITCILDGQQRLSALYIGLRGTYAKKIPWRRRNNPDNFIGRKLFVNLLGKAKDSEETRLLYDFKFLTEDESKKKDEDESKKEDENKSWFEVGRILGFSDTYELNNYLIEQGLSRLAPEKAKFANETLFKLYDVVRKEGVINYYMEQSQDLDKVLNMFVRINSAGSKLDYSDLLLSIASAQWQKKNARDEIIDFVDQVNKIGDGFDFDKDFVLKCCLILSDISNIAFKVDNFNKKNMQSIENNWDDIKKAIRLSAELVSSFGYDSKTLSSSNAIIPISYYIKMINSPNNFVSSKQYSEDRKIIKRWLATSLIMRTFSGQPDNVLRPIREIMKNKVTKFPLEEIQNKLKGTPKSLTLTDEDLDRILTLEYDEPYTYSTLALLYPTFDFRNKFHIDHIFPQDMFKKRHLKKYDIPEDKWDKYIEASSLLGNLQLLAGTINEEKSSTEPKKWINGNFNETERKEFCKMNMIPENFNLDFSQFISFVEERNKLIVKKLKDELGIL